MPAEERWQHEYPHNRSVCVCLLLHLSCETCKHARGRRALTKINQKCDGRKRLAGSPVEISDRAVSVLARSQLFLHGKCRFYESQSLLITNKDPHSYTCACTQTHTQAAKQGDPCPYLCKSIAAPPPPPPSPCYLRLLACLPPSRCPSLVWRA